MALRGIWQNANGGTRKQNGHWQSGGGGLLNAFLYSFGVTQPVFYFIGSVYNGSSPTNDFVFSPGKWQDNIKITAVIKTAPIAGRFSLAWSAAASGAFDRNTRITLHSQTAERLDFLMQEPQETIIAEDNSYYIQNFKMIHTPAPGTSGRDPLTMDATATINYTQQTITLSATIQAGSLRALEYDYDIDPAGDILRGTAVIGLQLEEEYTPELYPLYPMSNTTPNIRVTG